MQDFDPSLFPPSETTGEQRFLWFKMVAQGYTDLRFIDDRLCGLNQYYTTYGLLVGLTEDYVPLRYCFETKEEALASLLIWDGKEHPPGNWIKAKGIYQGEYLDLFNPNLKA